VSKLQEVLYRIGTLPAVISAFWVAGATQAELSRAVA
jgi:hypothetical protein